MWKIIMTQGLPASGKTTWAKQFIKDNPDWLYVSRNELREQMNLTIYTKQGEALVIEAERKYVKWALDNNRDIVIDNTHLNSRKGWLLNKHIEFYTKLAEEYRYKIEVKPFYVSIEEAIERDECRTKPVSKEVIERFAKFAELPKEIPVNPVFKDYENWKEEAIIIDLDGTLAFSYNRRWIYDWSKIYRDEINIPLAKIIYRLCTSSIQRTKIIIVSGREDKWIEESKEWIDNNLWWYDEIYFRKTGDKRNDAVVKEEIYRENIEKKYNILAVFDDRDRVIDMWRRIWLPTYQVYYGNF